MKDRNLTKEEYQRYSRHIILPHLGVQGQTKLKAAKILVVGAGGLGIPVLLYLAAAGVGELGIVDFDLVEFSNLQRQVIYKTEDVGKSKAQLAAKFVKEQNPLVQVNEYECWLDSNNALEILGDYDLIVDGTDNFPTRYLLNDAAVLLDMPYIYGSIFRFEGQVSVFNFNGGPHYRDLFPEPPAPELVPNCSEGGVLGVLPGMVGSMQALEALKVVTGVGEVLSGKLLTIDTLTNMYRSFRFGKRKDQPPITELIDYQQFCSPNHPLEEITSISALELKKWETTDKQYQLIDVREPYEFEIVNLGGDLFPKAKIDQYLDKIKRDIPVVVHCRSGKRSEEVIRHLKSEHAFDNLVNLEGGILAYATDVDPQLTVY
ncbi:molybdopterin-synthase adenylyltransferase MoeB [Portibacter marinus]|uniref:molybdopterin-synthase adenylyltransferase MoeB n=1 Tax=Portibacter marinus TaxID=2898660 RepID=UPI001F2C2D54|nr:molybdopterin-synthase adenylyltransferase MoeB [Portibacter marinus]